MPRSPARPSVLPAASAAVSDAVVALTEAVQSKLVTIRETPVILDVDIAKLYGVETRVVNQAVRNNPDKFPAGYVIVLGGREEEFLRSKILTLKAPGRGHFSKHGYKAFTERGLYMLATILKSPRATATTLAIVETFAKVRELKRELVELHTETDRKQLAQKTRHFGQALTDIVMPDLDTVETESTLELNFIIGKIKHTVKRIKKR